MRSTAVPRGSRYVALVLRPQNSTDAFPAATPRTSLLMAQSPCKHNSLPITLKCSGSLQTCFKFCLQFVQITSMKTKNIVAPPLSPTRSRRLVLGTCSATHFIHDGFSDLLYLLLPVWQAELGLSLTQVGVIRSLYSGALASTQIPIGLLSERLGERRLLALGTALTGGAYFALGMAESLATLVMFLLISGTGSGTQHPLCSSLVAKAYEGGSQRVALGF